ncbi:MAG: hypothetical protein KDB53_04145 [Planctomycetes bacterium]|nr:hypothetical protein [Planctomycetota bacterium]
MYQELAIWAATLVFCGTLLAQEPEPASVGKLVESVDKGYSLRVPETWALREKSADGPVIAFDATADCGRTAARLECGLYWIKRLHDPMAEAVYDRPSKKRNYDSEKVRIETRPLPHLIVEHEEGDVPMVDAFYYLVRRGRGLVFWASVDRNGWKEVEKEILGVAESAMTTLPAWPMNPEGFIEHRTKDGWRFLLEPGYRGDWKVMERLIKAEEKKFTRDHGKFEVSEDNPPTVLLFRIQSDMAEIQPYVAQAGFDYYCEPVERRLYAVQPPSKTDTEESAQLMREVYELFYILRYGDEQPEWYFRLQAQLVYEETLAGKKFPVLSSRGFGTLPDRLHRFDALYDEYRAINKNQMEPHLLVYAAAFLRGDKKYRQAYDAFEKELRKHGDYDLAMRHIMSLDLDQLQADATTTAQKVCKSAK